MEWLAHAGHPCHILTTARFESRVTFTIEDHLRQRGVAVPRRASRTGRSRPVVHYDVGDVPVTLLMTRHNDESRPERGEAAQYLALVEQLLNEFAPDQMIAVN